MRCGYFSLIEEHFCQHIAGQHKDKRQREGCSEPGQGDWRQYTENVQYADYQRNAKVDVLEPHP